MNKYYHNPDKTIFYKLEDGDEFIETRLDIPNLNLGSFVQAREETLDYFTRNAKFGECSYESWKEACEKLYNKLTKCQGI